MQPFRAPRNRLQKKTETRSDKSEAKVHVVPYNKGLRMMSDREATEMAQHGEVLRWSSDSEGDDEVGSNKTDCNVQDCQSYTEQYQHNRQDTKLLRQKSVGRKMACERKEGRRQSLSFIFLLPDPCIITGY